jgi:hypothetical protein
MPLEQPNDRGGGWMFLHPTYDRGIVSTPRFWLLFSSFGLASIVMLADFVAYGNFPFTKSEYPHNLSLLGLLRSATIAAAAYLLVRAVRSNSGELNFNAAFKKSEVIQYCQFITWCFFIFVVLMVVWNKPLFHYLRREDGYIEYISFLFIFIAALIMLDNVRLGNQCSGVHKRAMKYCFIFLGALLMIIAMEEISWGQRLIGYQTPEAFSQNWQREVNLHNFHSWFAEILYYTIALCAFVLLPYALIANVSRRHYPLATILAPAPAFVLVAAPTAFLQAEMWNNVLIMMGAWGTAFILIDIGFKQIGKERIYTLTCVAVAFVGQLVFLTLVEYHDNGLTEYKETMIAFLCLVYAVSTRQRVAADAKTIKSTPQ